MKSTLRSSAPGLLVLALILVVSSAFGQAVSSTVLGTVTDSSGAVVINAKVTVTEVSTRISRTAQTNESGNYNFADIPPGNYVVTVEMTGFKKESRKDISLLVNSSQRVDIQLQPGSITETVEVSGQPPILQTDRADTGRKLDTMAVSELPVLASNRNYQSLLNLVPGTAPATEQHSQFFNASDSLQTEVNGAPRQTNNYQIEGIDDNERTGLLQILIPPLEAIQTVDVSTSNHSVDLGRAGGAVTNVILKSGTNQFHGSGYEFLQNSDLNSRNFFQPGVGVVHYNYFGGTIGGPIKKNKLFFFADYLLAIDHEAVATTETIPFMPARGGDLSAACKTSTCNTATDPKVYDPLTGNQVTGQQRLQFPGNIIPTGRIDPVSTKIMNLLANYAPNQNLNSAASPSNNYFALLPFTKTTQYTDTKLDYNLSDKDRISGRFSFQRPVIYQAPIFGLAGGNANGAFEGTGVQKTYSSGVNWTHVFSPSLLGELRFGVAHYNNVAQASDYGTSASTNIGIPNINNSQFNSGLVGINLNGPFSNPIVGYSASLPWVRAEANIDVVNNWTKTHNNHTFTFGFDMRRLRDDLLQTQTYSPRGVYSFGTNQTGCSGGCLLDATTKTVSGATTADNVTSWANDMGSFLLGSPSSGGRDFSGVFPTYRAWQFFYYAADRWQVNNKLTLDIGLRWEMYPPGLPAFPGQFSNYIPSMNSLVVGGVGGNPNNGGLVNHLNYLAPRLGLAYRLTDKTVIRAGFGVSYTPFEDNTYINNNYPTKGNIGSQQNPAGSAYTTPIYNGALMTFANGLASPAPVPLPSNGIYGPATLAALGFNGSTEDFFPSNYKNPHVIAWNFTIQQALPYHFALDVAYVGNHGVDIGVQTNLNASPVIAATSAQGPLNQPYYPHTGSVVEFWQGASQSYNGLQVKLDRRFTSGLGITTAFTYAKGMGYQTGDDGGPVGFYLAGQGHRNWARNDFDRKFTFVQSYVYQLPFGKGKAFLSSAPEAVNKVVGGWQIEGILTVMTGTPVNFTGYTSTYLNAPGNTNTAQQLVQDVPILHGINTVANGGSAWFDPNAFGPAPCQSATPTTACPNGQQLGNIGRNSMTGPGFFNLNFAMSKTVPITERVGMQLRFETINLTNTPQFSNPNTSCCLSTGSTNFGTITGTVGSGSGVNAGTGGPRSAQVAVKFTF
jgi:hypothetical protein